jgi:hypothetical protein
MEKPLNEYLLNKYATMEVVMKYIQLNNMNYICLILFILLLVSCGGGGSMAKNKVVFKSLQDIKESKWNNLSKKKIYFGHQSVGSDIIRGIEDLQKINPIINLNILEKSNSNIHKSGVFLHSKIGINNKPSTKIDDFFNIFEQELKDSVDIAFLKLCYVDIAANTDIQNLFELYTSKFKI